jgi:site-specific DNA-cytosine methylase
VQDADQGHIVTVGTLRAHHPGTAGVQSDTDHIVAYDAAHAFEVRGGCEGGGKGYLGSDEVAFTLSTNQDQHIFSEAPAVAYAETGVFYGGQGAKAGSIAYSNDVSPTLKAGDSGTNRSPSAHIGSTVRRLTPVECERLQGFPDNFTAIPWRKKGAEDCPDGPRYKALGNSMAVPVMRWIGERIQMIEDMVE